MTDFLRRLLFRPQPSPANATVADAAAIAALHAASFRHGWSESEMERLLASNNVIADRAVSRGRVVAFLLSRRAADEAEILSVAVARAWRGRGLGRDILTRHLGRLAGFGIRSVFLEVDEQNDPAIHLYRNAGFHEVGRRMNYYPAAEGSRATALVLRRDLA